MNRREVLTATGVLLASGGLAGCSSVLSQSSDDSPDATPTETPGPDDEDDDTNADSGTPEPLPKDCSSPPAIDGLPALPETRNQDTVIEFVTEFEGVYGVATNDEYSALDSVRPTSVKSIGERYQVQLAVEAARSTPTPGPDGSTPTPEPQDASAYRTLYRLEGDTLVRELRDYAGGRELSSDCWTFDSGQ